MRFDMLDAEMPPRPRPLTEHFRVAAIVACLWMIASLPGFSASLRFHAHDSQDGRSSWAFEVGVAFITSNNIGEILLGDVGLESGPAGGEIYSVTASRRLGQFDIELWGQTFHPQLELPVKLEIVDEHSRNPFFDLNASVVVRWEEFPWNHIIKTSISTGLGLSYSEKIYLMDTQRHPGTDRSHLQFNWPIQVTFALPNFPKHQLSLFISHQSGAHIFSRGGVNSLGFGYRHDF